MKNGPRVWAFCKIEFPGIQKPVQFFGQKSCFFKKCGNRGVGVIWLVREVLWGLDFRLCCFRYLLCCFVWLFVLLMLVVAGLFWLGLAVRFVQVLVTG